MAHTPGPRDPDIQYIANLLATNDELLAACEALCDLCISSGLVEPEDMTLLKVQATIAKAEGETDDSHR